MGAEIRKVLFIAPPGGTVPPNGYGGNERLIAALIPRFRAAGWEIGLVAAAGSEDPGFFWPWDFSDFHENHFLGMRAVFAACRRFRPAIVCHFSRALYALATLPFCKKIISNYGNLPRGYARRLRPFFMGKAIYVGVSEWFTAESRRLMGGDWRTIYNGIEISGYTATASVGADAPLVFLSRIAPIKGCHLAIKAAKAAGCRLVIAGNIQDQAYFDRHIQPNLETGKIEYVGTVNDAQKNALLGRARALIVPVQWDEPFGLVFAESLACGTPVISWKRGALPEIIDHGRTGFLVTAEEALAPAIDRLHTLDRRACRESAERRFSAETLFRSYENLCLEALSRPSSMRRNP